MGISVKRTWDKDLIRSILTDPDIWDTIAEDGQESGLFETDLEKTIFLAVTDMGKTVGIYILHAFNGATLEIHANILPDHRKRCATQSGEKMLEWFRHYGPVKYHKLIAMIPAIYPHVYHFTLHRGFKDEGLIKKAYRKKGKLHDIHILGLERDTLKKVE